MAKDWGYGIVIDPRELHRLQADNTRLRAHGRRVHTAVACMLGALVVTAGVLYHQSGRVDSESLRVARLAQSLRETRLRAAQTDRALTVLGKAHEHILQATQEAPSVGTKSWGRRFVVTKYIPRAEEYGRFNDGLTSTMKKADPTARIVAVDPKLIPYGSRVWIEGIGWFNAEDCGSAIKGFRLDLLTATRADAMQFGRQERFVIVVPPTANA